MFSAQRSLQYWSHPMCVCVCLLCRALSLILFLFTFLEFCLFNFLRFVKVSLWSPIIFFVCLCVCSNVCAAWVEAVGESFYKIDWLTCSDCEYTVNAVVFVCICWVVPSHPSSFTSLQQTVDISTKNIWLLQILCHSTQMMSTSL